MTASMASALLGRPGVRITRRDASGAGPATWAELGDIDWADATVVLGAGGATGLAFETGLLLALATDHGFAPEAVPSYVGTSAGSLAAALLVSGCTPDELAAMATGSDRHAGALAAAHGIALEPTTIPLPSWTHFVRVPTPALLWRGAHLLARGRFAAALVHALPDGRFDLRDALEPLGSLEWPAVPERLRVCATDRADGRRVVFGSEHGISLVDAVAASCAVPAVMRPVRHGRAQYVDGGVVSPTSADLALGAGRPRDVIVLSPMSGASARSVLGRTSAAHSRLRLDLELRRIGSDQRVFVLEPHAGLSSAVVDDALESDRVPEIVGSAFLAAGISRPRHRVPCRTPGRGARDDRP